MEAQEGKWGHGIISGRGQCDLHAESQLQVNFIFRTLLDLQKSNKVVQRLHQFP
jgi:hypothetical protein